MYQILTKSEWQRSVKDGTLSNECWAFFVCLLCHYIENSSLLDNSRTFNLNWPQIEHRRWIYQTKNKKIKSLQQFQLQCESLNLYSWSFHRNKNIAHFGWFFKTEESLKFSICCYCSANFNSVFCFGFLAHFNAIKDFGFFPWILALQINS